MTDFGPIRDGCDPETCTDRAGGDHSPTCQSPDCGSGSHTFGEATSDNGGQTWYCRACEGPLKVWGPDLTDWAPGEIVEAYGR